MSHFSAIYGADCWENFPSKLENVLLSCKMCAGNKAMDSKWGIIDECKFEYISERGQSKEDWRAHVALDVFF